MKRIFYGLCGEGLGHATRTMAVIDYMPDVEFHIFTYGAAETYFKRINYQHLYPIDGMMFSYKDDRVDSWGTLDSAYKFITGPMKKNVEFITEKAKEIKPDLFISDFEPSVPRAAKECGGKLISLDNQHRFAYVDMIHLPLWLRVYGWFCGFVAKLMVPNPDHRIISTFHWDKIRIRGHNVVLTNGLLRKEVAEMTVKRHDYILVYLRKSISTKVLEAIRNLDESFIVFGYVDPELKVDLERQGNFEFYLPSPVFVHYLASCKAVISTAGNQLMTEARYFGKPIIYIPEPGQHEQAINAAYAGSLDGIGLGDWCPADSISERYLKMGLTKCSLRYRRPFSVPNGVHKVTEVIRKYLE